MFGYCVGAVLALAILYLLIATPYYTGSSRLYVQRQGPRVIGNESYRGDDNGTFLFTQREIARSTPVLAIALADIGDLQTFKGERNRFAFLKNNLEVEIGKKDELMSISFDSPYQEEASKIVAAVVQGYVNFQSKQRRTTAGDVLKRLTDDREKNETELLKKENELDVFRAEKALLVTDPDKQGAGIERLRGISDQLNAAKLEALAAKTDHEESLRSTLSDPEKQKKVAELLNVGGFAMLSADDLKLLRTELLGYETRLNDVKRQYGPRHPTVQLLQSRVDQLQISYAAAVERRYQLAQQRQADVQKLYDEQHTQAREDASKAAEYTRLQERVAALRKYVDMLDGRIKEVNLAEDGGTPTITVLEPAHVDDKPSSPSKKKALAIALILGLLAGTGACVVRDKYDSPLTSARDIRDTLGTRVLGFIPHLAADAALGMRRMQATVATSDVAEASRSLYSAICFSIPAERLKTILVTSPARSDGKTTLAGNLAIAMAQLGKRVLLVNADFRSPALDRIFELEGRHGLANVLEGKEIPEAAVHESGIAGLDVLPSGNILKNPIEMLNSQRFMAVLDHLSDVYDHVVIDAPPAVMVNDARIVAAHCDVTLLVLRANRSNRRQSEMARDGLMSVGANLLGVVVNDVAPRSYGQYDGVYDDLPPVPQNNEVDKMKSETPQLQAWLDRRPAPTYRNQTGNSGSPGGQPVQRSAAVEHISERDDTV